MCLETKVPVPEISIVEIRKTIWMRTYFWSNCDGAQSSHHFCISVYFVKCRCRSYSSSTGKILKFDRAFVISMLWTGFCIQEFRVEYMSNEFCHMVFEKDILSSLQGSASGSGTHSSSGNSSIISWSFLLCFQLLDFQIVAWISDGFVLASDDEEEAEANHNHKTSTSVTSKNKNKSSNTPKKKRDVKSKDTDELSDDSVEIESNHHDSDEGDSHSNKKKIKMSKPSKSTPANTVKISTITQRKKMSSKGKAKATKSTKTRKVSSAPKSLKKKKE